MERKIFSVSAAAKYLGVFSLTLRNWEKKKLIKSFRTLGGHRRFKKEELDRISGTKSEGDIINESIFNLEKVDFLNGRKEKLNSAVELLKSISETSK